MPAGALLHASSSDSSVRMLHGWPVLGLQGLEHSGEHSEEWAKAQSCSASAEIFIQQPKCSILVHALPKSCTGKCLGGKECYP